MTPRTKPHAPPPTQRPRDRAKSCMQPAPKKRPESKSCRALPPKQNARTVHATDIQINGPIKIQKRQNRAPPWLPRPSAPTRKSLNEFPVSDRNTDSCSLPPRAKMSDFEQASVSANRTVTKRETNSVYRAREYLTPDEMAKLIEAARGNRYGHRDATLMLTIYRHALRAQEACDLEWPADRFQARRNAHQARKAWQAFSASNPWRRAARPSPPAARAGPHIKLCLHHGARRPDDARRLE